MPLTHRPFELRDLAAICRFPQNADELFFMFPKARYPLTPDQLAAVIAERTDATVAELDGEPVGFANFHQWGLHSVCSIGNLIVAPAARGQGVGTYLIRHMVELAFAKYQASEVAISCFNENVTGLLLYTKLGFRPYGIEERRDHRGRRVALIHLRLLPPVS